jgi:hypothetical protein
MRTRKPARWATRAVVRPMAPQPTIAIWRSRVAAMSARAKRAEPHDSDQPAPPWP